MNNFSFFPFFLTIIAVIGGVAGITFLIIGLVQSKRKYWLPGAITFAFSVIIGVIGMIFSINSFVTTISQNVNKLKSMKSHDSYIHTDTTTYSDRPVDSTFDEPTSGFIEDKENSLVYIKVFPKKVLIGNYISIEKVQKGRSSNIISLVVNFKKDFSGKLKLIVFDYEKHQIGNSEINLEKKSGDKTILDFLFPADVDFSIIDYSTLVNE